MERFLEKVTSPGVGYSIAIIIVLALVLYHFRQMALIKTGLIKKYGLRGRRIDKDNLFGGLVLIFLGGAIAATIYYQLSFWLGFWIFIGLLGVGLVISALVGRDRTFKYSRD